VNTPNDPQLNSAKDIMNENISSEANHHAPSIIRNNSLNTMVLNSKSVKTRTVSHHDLKSFQNTQEINKNHKAAKEMPLDDEEENDANLLSKKLDTEECIPLEKHINLNSIDHTSQRNLIHKKQISLCHSVTTQQLLNKTNKGPISIGGDSTTFYSSGTSSTFGSNLSRGQVPETKIKITNPHGPTRILKKEDLTNPINKDSSNIPDYLNKYKQVVEVRNME
jgi:hypothetical protein